jgi:hypothetical protein
MKVNLLKYEVHLNNIDIFLAYPTEDTQRLHKDQLVSGV